MHMFVKLLSTADDLEIFDFSRFIQEHNIEGLRASIVHEKPAIGEMSSAEPVSVAELVLGSTVLATGIKGLFDVFIKYFELKAKGKLTKHEKENQKIEFWYKNDKGEEFMFVGSKFDQTERNKFNEIIDKVIGNEH